MEALANQRAIAAIPLARGQLRRESKNFKRGRSVHRSASLDYFGTGPIGQPAMPTEPPCLRAKGPFLDESRFSESCAGSSKVVDERIAVWINGSRGFHNPPKKPVKKSDRHRGLTVSRFPFGRNRNEGFGAFRRPEALDFARPESFCHFT
jgi:hypothetical protein